MVNSVFLELGHFTAILNKTLIGTQPVRHNEKPGLGTQMLREYFSKEANLRGEAWLALADLELWPWLLVN